MSKNLDNPVTSKSFICENACTCFNRASLVKIHFPGCSRVFNSYFVLSACDTNLVLSNLYRLEVSGCL